MEEDTNYENYKVKDMMRILAEARKNPNHGYPPELIQKFEMFEKECTTSLPKSSMIEATKGVERAIEVLRRQNPFLEAYNNSPRAQWAKKMEHFNLIHSASERLERTFAEPVWSKHVRQIEEIAKNLPAAMGVFYEKLSLLSEQGWYVSPRPFDKVSFSKIPYYLQPENSIEFEELIVEEIEQVLPELISDCQKSFPNRADIFDEIHQLYNNGFYRAVVTLCYTQADGISNEIFNVDFFGRNGKKDWRLKSYLKLRDMEFNHSIGIIRQLDIPTNEITAYSGSEYLKEENKRKSSFNRHLVLHGHSTEYGTQLNAIRAICVLDFLQYLTEAVELE